MATMHCVVSVEDDLGIFQVIKASLRKLPIELHHAASGNAAIDLIEQKKPRLIILDNSVPYMNGSAEDAMGWQPTLAGKY